MKGERGELSIVECLQCGRKFGTERDVVETNDGAFVCERCYEQILIPGLKVNCMEIIDEIRK